jgi:soluble lytic murein transglycosylase-like protein
VAGHRSPHGRRSRTSAGAASARHQAAHAPGASGPSLRSAVLATAATVGAVATGTFSAIVPTPGDGTNMAAAEEGPVDARLAASSAALPAALPDAGGSFVRPVSLPVDETTQFDAAEQHLALLDKAAELAQELAEQQAAAAERARIDAIIAEGGVDGWIAKALRILELPQSLAPGVKEIVMAESNGNPHAINNWDSNARRGTPSQGLMQTIPSTFRAYVHPELSGRSITDPVANITAGVRYMIDHYGMDTLAAGGRTNSSGDYVGY